MSSQLEKFLTGQPLSEENAALMEGREPAAEAIFKQDQAESGPLTDDDRTWLRRLVNEPGFAVLLRLLNSTIIHREESAKVLSSIDPFGQKDKIASEWAYIACFKAIMKEIRMIVESTLR